MKRSRTCAGTFASTVRPTAAHITGLSPQVGTHIMGTWPTHIELAGNSGKFDYVEFVSERQGSIFSTTIQPPYDHHTTTMQSTKDGSPSLSTGLLAQGGDKGSCMAPLPPPRGPSLGPSPYRERAIGNAPALVPGPAARLHDLQLLTAFPPQASTRRTICTRWRI